MAKVFVSYSHRDEPWKERVVKHLTVLAGEGLDVWDDRRIGAGADWETEIAQAIADCDLALLLVSADFLTSRFILGQEVPPLLQRRQDQGIRVVPLILSPCAWTRIPWLRAIQARPKDGKALSGMSRHAAEAALADLAGEIDDIFRSDGPLASDASGSGNRASAGARSFNSGRSSAGNRDPLASQLPIARNDVLKLRQILSVPGARMLQENVEPLLARVLRRPVPVESMQGRSPFDAALEELQRLFHGPEEFPLLVFLQACRIKERFDDHLSEAGRNDLERWLDSALGGVGANPETLAARVAAVLNPPPQRPPPTLVLKIEPRLDLVEDRYCLQSWWGYAESAESGPTDFDWLQDREHPSECDDKSHFGREYLSEKIREAIAHACRSIRPDRRRERFRVEIVLPWRLFAWSPSTTLTKPNLCLPHFCPVVLRSWDRNCRWPRLEIYDDPQTPGAWASKSDAFRGRTPTGNRILLARGNTELADKLRGEYWAVIAPAPSASDGSLEDDPLWIGLREGLPLMFWPLVEALDKEDADKEVRAWLCGTSHFELPELMFEARCSRYPHWKDLAVLCDDARCPIPDRDYLAHST